MVRALKRLNACLGLGVDEEEVELPVAGSHRVCMLCIEWPGEIGYSIADRLNATVIPSRLLTTRLHILVSAALAAYMIQKRRSIARKKPLNMLAVYMATRNISRVIEVTKPCKGEPVLLVALDNDCERLKKESSLKVSGKCCPKLKEAFKEITGMQLDLPEEQLERILLTRSAIVAGLGKI